MEVKERNRVFKPESWVENHRIPVASGDTSLASSTKRRIITAGQIQDMIEDAVCKDRKQWSVRIQEESRAKVKAVRDELRHAISEFERVKGLSDQLNRDNRELRDANARLVREKKEVFSELQKAFGQLKFLRVRLLEAESKLKDAQENQKKLIVQKLEEKKLENTAAKNGKVSQDSNVPTNGKVKSISPKPEEGKEISAAQLLPRVEKLESQVQNLIQEGETKPVEIKAAPPKKVTKAKTTKKAVIKKVAPRTLADTSARKVVKKVTKKAASSTKKAPKAK